MSHLGPPRYPSINGKLRSSRSMTAASVRVVDDAYQRLDSWWRHTLYQEAGWRRAGGGVDRVSHFIGRRHDGLGPAQMEADAADVGLVQQAWGHALEGCFATQLVRGIRRFGGSGNHPLVDDAHTVHPEQL